MRITLTIWPTWPLCVPRATVSWIVNAVPFGHVSEWYALELYQPKWVNLKTTSRIYLSSQLETNKSSRQRTRVCQQKGDSVYLTWCWAAHSLPPSYFSRRLCVDHASSWCFERFPLVFTHTAGVESHFLSLGNPVQWTRASVWSLGRSWQLRLWSLAGFVQGRAVLQAFRQCTTAAEECLIPSDIILEVENQPPQPFVQSFVWVNFPFWGRQMTLLSKNNLAFFLWGGEFCHASRMQQIMEKEKGSG